MKYLKAMYFTMAFMLLVNLASEYIFKGEYSAIAAWLCTMLFLLGTIFFVNARFFLEKNKNS
ncbi:hypothetical protein ABE096_05930 [Robertmurraya massiliosenegalensis]|uniref:hypothetical protein n=1 Tax=Robertmurraya TaxID=2837507 RepID=UPI0039A75E5E